MPGVRQRQSETKAFVNARRSSMPVRDQGIRQCHLEDAHLWTNMLLCASVFKVCIAFVLCLQVSLYAESFLWASVFKLRATFVLCLQSQSLLCASVTIFMSPTWDALLTPVLVRHPGNAFELVSKRLRGQQSPRVCTLTPTVTIILHSNNNVTL